MHTAIKTYIHLFENLSEIRIQKMNEFVAEDVTFKDPFNQVSSLPDLQSILYKTLKDVDHPTFQVSHIYQQDDSYILKWTFSGRIPVLGMWDFDGLSEISINKHGKICSHIDYWDASEHFYMRIPVLGSFIRAVRRRLQV
ncbi:DUF2358 domain-containing protein [Curvivirga aplysinae]|uniref:DUF2358 domain-containing protein n=1 Tax=Curvivirga aplysinae TaxID=2529852 RepID=UPI0012BC8A54|nr:DUF2358 domain-containing protein [Curvivirga aplysinae]MTI08890.1 DUF2358 domain-containing protein [Curvivirga aplysinae]